MIQFTIESLFKLLLAIILVGVFLGIVMLVSGEAEGTAARGSLELLCPAWYNIHCPYDQASTELMNACEKDFGAAWTVAGTWEHCKSLCTCPT